MAYQILSLDGGGAWALIEVRTLIRLFGSDARGHDVLRRFDLVAANSGGSIVLAGLVENLTLTEILGLFENEANRKTIFSPTKSWGDDVLRKATGMGPKYNASAKLPALERFLPITGAKPLDALTKGLTGPAGNDVHLLIVAFDYDRNAAAYFRSGKTTEEFGASLPATVSLAEAVHASTNAPVNYFDAPAILPGCPDRYWDGGLTGNNNPALVAAVEAVALGRAPGELRVLSLGTGTVRLPLADAGAPASPFLAPRPSASLLLDIQKLATAVLDDPPDFATFVVHAMTGGGAGVPHGAVSRIVRINPLISPRWDGAAFVAPEGWTQAQFQHLASLDMDAIEAADVAYIDAWCTSWMADNVANQPIRMDEKTLQPIIGYGRFSEALAAWEALSAGAH